MESLGRGTNDTVFVVVDNLLENPARNTNTNKNVIFGFSFLDDALFKFQPTEYYEYT